MSPHLLPIGCSSAVSGFRCGGSVPDEGRVDSRPPAPYLGSQGILMATTVSIVDDDASPRRSPGDLLDIFQRGKGLWRSRAERVSARALAGGGVIGGMYEVGAVAALEDRLNGDARFHVYVGCSAGSVVASLLAHGVRGSEILR